MCTDHCLTLASAGMFLIFKCYILNVIFISLSNRIVMTSKRNNVFWDRLNNSFFFLLMMDLLFVLNTLTYYHF